MTNREELEAVIAGAIEDLPMRDCAEQGGELDRLRVREAIRAVATALLSSGYTNTDDLPWRISDIKRGLILFRTSNNAHGHTNHSTLSDRVDALPDRAKQELAGMMVNMATGLDPSVMGRFGYTKGNGELVEAVREALAVLSEPITYADKVALRSSLQAALDHSTSEGVGQTNGDHHDEG